MTIPTLQGLVQVVNPETGQPQPFFVQSWNNLVTRINGVKNGGTGLSATPANGQIPIGNGTGYTLANLTAGANVTITNAAGSITIAASGTGGGSGTVTSVGLTMPTGFTVTGSPVTTTGTLAVTTSLSGYVKGSAGAFSAASTVPTTDLSGTLQAAQFPALTGDVTNTAGTVATTISAGSVTLAKMANLAANSILGNNTGVSATPLALTATQVKALLAIAASDVSGLATVATSGSATDLSAGTLAAARMPALTGDVTTTAGSVATTIANNAVTLAKTSMNTGKLLGRTTAAVGAFEEITPDTSLTLASGGLKLTAYIFSTFFTSTPTASEVLMLHVAGVAFTIPANFTGALQSSVGTNPTATFALDVQNNGTSIGTISVSTGGVVTATTSGGTSKSIAAGNVIKIVAPGTADATAANMAFTVVGQR